MKSLQEIISKNKDTDSPIEQLLYEEFVKVGIVPIPQFQVGYFIIDLAFPEIKLGIEADGSQFHSSKTQKERDKYRQERLEEQGWIIERFSGHFIHKDKEVIVAKILAKYFGHKLSEEQKIKVGQSFVSFFTKDRQHKDVDFALRLTEKFLIERENSKNNH